MARIVEAQAADAPLARPFRQRGRLGARHLGLEARTATRRRACPACRPGLRADRRCGARPRRCRPRGIAVGCRPSYEALASLARDALGRKPADHTADHPASSIPAVPSCRPWRSPTPSSARAGAPWCWPKPRPLGADGVPRGGEIDRLSGRHQEPRAACWPTPVPSPHDRVASRRRSRAREEPRPGLERADGGAARGRAVRHHLSRRLQRDERRSSALYNSVMARGDVVIANSRYTADLIAERYGTPPQSHPVIHRGVDAQRFDPRRDSAGAGRGAARAAGASRRTTASSCSRRGSRAGRGRAC